MRKALRKLPVLYYYALKMRRAKAGGMPFGIPVSPAGSGQYADPWE